MSSESCTPLLPHSRSGTLLFAKTEFSFLGKEQCFKYTFIHGHALPSQVHSETVDGLVILWCHRQKLYSFDFTRWHRTIVDLDTMWLITVLFFVLCKNAHHHICKALIHLLTKPMCIDYHLDEWYRPFNLYINKRTRNDRCPLALISSRTSILSTQQYTWDAYSYDEYLNLVLKGSFQCMLTSACGEMKLGYHRVLLWRENWENEGLKCQELAVNVWLQWWTVSRN